MGPGPRTSCRRSWGRRGCGRSCGQLWQTATWPLLGYTQPLEQVSPLSSNSALTHSLTRQPALFKAGRKEQPRAEQRGSQVLVLLQQYPSRLPSSSDLLGGPQFSHLQTGNSFPARLHLPCLPPRLRRMGRDTGVKHSVT